MGDGTSENPYTREDVLRLIEENGGKARGLDLSSKYFKERINLNQTNLEGIILNYSNLVGANFKLARLSDASFIYANLKETNFNDASLKNVQLLNAQMFSTDLTGAYFEGSNFKGAYLITANLKDTNLKNACLDKVDLMGANFEKSKLVGTSLNGANLFDAHFSGVYLSDVQFDNNTKFEHVNWCDFILGEEIEGEKTKNRYFFNWAIDTYRRLKIWYTEHGIYDTAGMFFYREMEVKRKVRNWKEELHLKLWSWILRLLCGYGEKPERSVISAAAVIFVFTLTYFGLNSWSAFGHSLYFSAVSFTAIGYGGWINEKWINIKSDWIIGFGVTETVLGVFMMALLLVTFVRKWTR